MTLVKYIKANRTAPLFMLICQAGFMVFGVAMVLIINTFINEDPDYACMGAFFVLIGTIVGILARGNTSGATRFHLAIAMGQTRRSYLFCDAVVTLINGILGLAIAWCAYQFEKWLYALLYPGYEQDMPLDGVYQLKWLILILAGLVLLDLIFGAITLRFGPKGFSAIWLGTWIPFMIIPRAIEAYTEGSTSIFARLGGLILAVATALPVKMWIGIGVAVVLVLLAFSVSVFRRAEVRSL